MTLPQIRRDQITGIVLAGGLGLRMGGADKGLQLHRGRPLAWHALQRLAPQVGTVVVCANRHLDDYRALGAPVVSDPMPGHPGPLAGVLAGLQHCDTPWLLTVPCDSPGFPGDLAALLSAAAVSSGAAIAMACTREDHGLQKQPVFSLVSVSLAPSLVQFLADGGRSIARWADLHHAVDVPFDDIGAFANANTVEDLQRLQ